MSYTPSEQTPPPCKRPRRRFSHIEPDDIGVGMLTVLFAFVAVVVLLFVVLLQAWFYNWKVDLLAQRNGPIDVQRRPSRSPEQLQRIESYGWADRKNHGPRHSDRPGDGVGRRGIGGRAKAGCYRQNGELNEMKSTSVLDESSTRFD